MCVTGIEQPAEQDQKRRQNDDAEKHRDPAYGQDTQNVKERRGPDDHEADDQPEVNDPWEKERGVSDKEDRIDREIEKGIEPGPPAFEEGPAKAKGVLDPLVIPPGHRHEAVELENGEDGRDVP